MIFIGYFGFLRTVWEWGEDYFGILLGKGGGEIEGKTG